MFEEGEVFGKYQWRWRGDIGSYVSPITPVHISPHEGDCCGMGHVYGIHNLNKDILEDIIESFSVEDGEKSPLYKHVYVSPEYEGNYLLEIVVASDQRSSSHRGENLKEALSMCELVNEFVNKNSGNEVSVYHLKI